MKAYGIGETETVEMPGVAVRGRVSMKAEFANPFGSVKDRTAAYLLASAREQHGSRVNVVESTSGNLGGDVSTVVDFGGGHDLQAAVTLSS